jgi:NADPH2:quinone reductase
VHAAFYRTGPVPLAEARLRNLRIGFELMLTPQLRGLTAAREHQVDILRQCGDWIDQGRLKFHVSRVLPLSQATEAHRLIETGRTVGKVVLSVC